MCAKYRHSLDPHKARPAFCDFCGDEMWFIYDTEIRSTCIDCGGVARRDSRAALEAIKDNRERNNG